MGKLLSSKLLKIIIANNFDARAIIFRGLVSFRVTLTVSLICYMCFEYDRISLLECAWDIHLGQNKVML